jgi:hypothetical protein
MFIFLLRKDIIFLLSLIFVGNSRIIQTIMIQINKKLTDNFDYLAYIKLFDSICSVLIKLTVEFGYKYEMS